MGLVAAIDPLVLARCEKFCERSRVDERSRDRVFVLFGNRCKEGERVRCMGDGMMGMMKKKATVTLQNCLL